MNSAIYKMSLFLSWRSLWRHKRRTLITIAAIALGLALNVVMISFADGMYFRTIQDAVQEHAGHIVLEHPSYEVAHSIDLIVERTPALMHTLNNIKGIASIKQSVQGGGLLRSGYEAANVSIFGILPEYEISHGSQIAKKITDGRYLRHGDNRDIILSEKLARRLKVSLKSRVVLVANNIHSDMTESLFRVRGIFKESPDGIDTGVIHIPLTAAQHFYGMRSDQLTRLGIMAENPDNRDALLQDIRQHIHHKTIAILPWEEVLPNLAAYIRTDRFMNFVISGMFIFLVLFTIFNTIMMSVLERKKEFATVLSLGTPPNLLRAQVMQEGILLAFIGCVVGAVIGYFFYLPLHTYGVDLKNLFPEGMSAAGVSLNTYVHARMTESVAVKLFLIVFTVTSAMALLPMIQSTRVDLTRRG